MISNEGAETEEMMTPEEVKAALLANEGKRVRITYYDGVIESADVHPVDDEGFVHTRPDQDGPRSGWPTVASFPDDLWWTRFDSVTDVQSDGL
jgi:hypothetical protein